LYKQTLSLDADILSPVLPPLISELLRLMSDAELMETKRRVDGVLNSVISQAGKRVSARIGCNLYTN
jgi:hypothetical protein